MKSFVQSLYLFTNAIGSALNEALVPATGDPDIVSKTQRAYSMFEMWMV